MPFIGNQPALSYTSFAKQDFTTSATTSYTLDNPVANANELALFINFVRQEPTTAYSASGTSLTLTSATSASDDMYCVYLGKAVQTVNPPNASVGASQIVDASITSGKLFSGFANGITVADQWRLTANFTNTASPISSNLERVDTAGQGTLGSAMTVSSGVFTFPSTGIWLVEFNHYYQFKDGNASSRRAIIEATTDNSNYNTIARLDRNGLDEGFDSRNVKSLIDVTDTSNVKVRFTIASSSTNDITIGNSDQNHTFFTFIRLGDT